MHSDHMIRKQTNTIRQASRNLNFFGQYEDAAEFGGCLYSDESRIKLIKTEWIRFEHFYQGTMVDNSQEYRLALGHSLVRSLVRSHRSLVRLLRTARFARALRCAHSFARSLPSLTPSLVGK